MYPILLSLHERGMQKLRQALCQRAYNFLKKKKKACALQEAGLILCVLRHPDACPLNEHLRANTLETRR